MRALIVDHQFTQVREIVSLLKSAGGVVDQVDNGEEALDLSRHYDYDIALVELLLPDMEGYEVVRRMRNLHNDTPVIVLSELSRPQAKIKAFAVGADDFIIKPFNSGELLARIHAIIRRSKGFSHASLEVGPLVLNLDRQEVTVNGKMVHLTNKEYAILELLVLRKGMALSKETFLNHLYGGLDEPEIKIIDVFVCKLRKKLAQAGANNLIGTIWGRGYILRATSGNSDYQNSGQLERPLRVMVG